MEVKIGDDDGIEIKFCGDCLEVSVFFGASGLITANEARMAADVLRLLAEQMDRSLNDGD